MERARALTPGCAEVLHLNHAGASLMTQPVLDAMTGHLRREAATGGYEAAEEAAPAVEHTYDALATLLGCNRNELALTDSATRAWDIALYSLPIEPQDRILISRAEYGSNAIALSSLRHPSFDIYMSNFISLTLSFHFDEINDPFTRIINSFTVFDRVSDLLAASLDEARPVREAPR